MAALANPFGVTGALPPESVRSWVAVRRFAVLLAWETVAIPVIYYRWDVVLLQQPGRYRPEAESVLVLLVVFGAERGLAGRPRWLLAELRESGN